MCNMKRFITIFLALILALGLGACQKTPEHAIVVGKDLDNMIDKAAESPVTTDAGDDLRAPLKAPEKLTLETKGKKGNLTIHVNADVVVPPVAAMPIARVTKGQFREKDVKNLFEALCGDAQPISPDSQPQGEYYLKQVREFQEMKRTGNYDEKFTADNIDDVIEYLMKQAADAPTRFEHVKPDFSFKENRDQREGYVGAYARLCFTRDEKTISEVYVAQDADGTGASAEYLRNKYSYNASYNETAERNAPSITEQDALKRAQEIITKLGLPDFVCRGKRESAESIGVTGGNHPGSGAYEFMFTRTINHTPITYTDDDGVATVHDAYFRPWMYEKIRIFIDDEDVSWLTWHSPYAIKEIVSETSSMLPFSDIQDAIKTMLPIKYDYMDGDEEYYFYKMNITEIRLGLMRITEKNVGDSGLIIPVWDLFGTLTSKTKSGKPGPAEGDEAFTYTSFLTINAIDGSIVDRELGY